MKKVNLVRAVVSGIIGTMGMSILVMMASMMGMNMVGPWKMLSDFMGMAALIGWIGHFMIGTILAFIYAGFFTSRLTGDPWLRGAIYGILPWLMAQVVVIPMMGMPLFSGSAMMAMGSLMGHLVYGSAMGAVYGKIS